MIIIQSASEVRPPAAFVSIVVIAGLHYDDIKSQALAKYANDMRGLWPLAEEFVQKHKGPKRVWDKFKAWCAAPPKNEKGNFDPFDDMIGALKTKTFLNLVRKNPALSDAEIAVTMAALTWASTGSERAFAVLQKSGLRIGVPPSVVSLVAPATASQDKGVKELTKLLESAGIELRPNLRVEIPEAIALKSSKPALAAKIAQVRKELLALYDEELRRFVVSNDGDPVDVEAARKHMEQRGYKVTKIPRGFVGKIGDDGRLYTTEGLEIDIKTAADVKMNPSYDPKTDNAYVFTYAPYAGAKDQTAQTVARKSRNREKRFEVVDQLAGKLEAVRAKFLKDLKGKDPVNRTLATMLELQYATAMRIGTAGNGTKNAKGEVEPTFGLSTLQINQVKVLPAGALQFVFPGKAGVPAKYRVTPADLVSKQIIANIKALLVTDDGEKKGPKEYVFEDKTGRYSGDRVNKYLKAISGIPDITNHKIRHMRGTKLASEIVVKAPKKMEQKAAEKWFLDAMTEVGKLLNHVKGVGSEQKVTPATALRSYIDPRLSLGFFESRGLRVPKFLQTLVKRS